MDRYEEALERARIEVLAHPECRKIWEEVFPELAESEDEKIRMWLLRLINTAGYRELESDPIPGRGKVIAWLEKQKENPKSADSTSSDCVSNAKCRDRWHKVEDSLPDDGREVLAEDNMGNVLLARYDGDGWDVSVYDNEDYRCHNGISRWIDIPSAEQPAEWSEEDEDWSKYLLYELYAGLVDYCGAAEKDMRKAIKWFETRIKSLRPQLHWKPSEEQMLVLRQIVAYNEDAINEIGDGYAAVLESLYEQLKKL